MKPHNRIALHKILTHQNNITCLSICKNVVSYIVSICILKSTRKRQDST